MKFNINDAILIHDAMRATVIEMAENAMLVGNYSRELDQYSIGSIKMSYDTVDVEYRHIHNDDFIHYDSFELPKDKFLEILNQRLPQKLQVSDLQA